MKLSQEDIEIIEGILTRVENGDAAAHIARGLGLGKYGQQQISATLCVLERAGVRVPPRLSAGERKAAEWREFQEWKRQRETGSASPRLLRPNGSGDLVEVSPHN